MPLLPDEFRLVVGETVELLRDELLLFTEGLLFLLVLLGEGLVELLLVGVVLIGVVLLTGVELLLLIVELFDLRIVDELFLFTLELLLRVLLNVGLLDVEVALLLYVLLELEAVLLP